MGFQSISYQDLAGWWLGTGQLPDRPILFDFDHPDWTIYKVIHPIMFDYGFQGNLFINTSPMEKVENPYHMTWAQVDYLVNSGWHIGAHTHNHYDLDYLARIDPSGLSIREQLAKCDQLIEANLGIKPLDFAYTSTTWSRIAEVEVKKRYRFARLWIIGAHYNTDEGQIRFADLVGSAEDDAPDGGPPVSTRYITRRSDPYRLPSMELEYLIYEFDAFRGYLEGALVGLEA